MHNFLPQGQVTGIGSLPHVDPDEAVRFVAQHSPTIPFWAQLPQRSDDEMMLPQMLALLQDVLQRRSTAQFEIPSHRLREFHQRLREADAILDENSAAGFYAFERACMANVFPQAIALKGQITGIVTLAHCIFVDDKPLAAMPETLAYFTYYLCRLGVWQVQRLNQFGKPVLIFIDEPALGLGALAEKSLVNLRKLVMALRSAGAYVGVHCCASDLPDLICRAKPDIISFDAHQGLEAFLSNSEVQTFVSAGGWLALGLIPTWTNLDQFDATQAFVRLVNAVEGKYDLSQFASHSLITATCGLGLLPIESAATSFTKCYELSHLIQKTLPNIESSKSQ